MNVAAELQHLRANRKLVRAAELGFVCQLRCEMPVCFYPDSSPPRGYYPLPNPTSEGRWVFLPNDGRNPRGPTADHYPPLEYQGGTLIPRTSGWLSMLETSSQPERMAWLAQVVPGLEGPS
jgi:hypothetical protein